MLTGIQYHSKLNAEAVSHAGFAWIEVEAGQIMELMESGHMQPISGVVVSAAELIQEDMAEILEMLDALEAGYLLIDTRDFTDHILLDDYVQKAAPLLQQSSLFILLENGYYTGMDGDFRCYPYSEIDYLKSTVEKYNQWCGRESFGMALNVGNANLLCKNLVTFVREAGTALKLVHMNDNDGKQNLQQMPFTFTRERGERTTDIFRLIGTLNRTGYRGWMIFDTAGLWEKLPVALQEGYLRLMQALIAEWEEQLKLEEKLSRPGKQLILFGTGAMAYNYMCEWGLRYTPAFIVDNNPELWGQERWGVPIKSPEALLEVPEEQRNVFICNQYYDAVGSQLQQMGVKYECYHADYYG